MKDLYEILDKIGVKYTKHEHPPVYTCEEADNLRIKLKGASSKHLFLRNKKGNKHYLLIMLSSKRADLKTLAKILNESKLSFASEERLQKHLGLTPGAVSPFGLINNESHDVVVVVDKEVWNHDTLNFHPNVNTATLEISRDDFEKFIKWCGNEMRIEEM
ncbi:prolyl-tRNA synthetase associated domain-containing protein [Patescibacteria group bacterium]